MKKLLMICAAIMVSSATFAQTEKKTETSTTTTATTETKGAHECYMMKDGALMHCTGTDAKAQSTDVTLKNGTVITTKGEITRTGGAKEVLANNQCIDLNGRTGDCDKMHASIKMHKEEIKKEEIKTDKAPDQK